MIWEIKAPGGMMQLRLMDGRLIGGGVSEHQEGEGSRRQQQSADGRMSVVRESHHAPGSAAPCLLSRSLKY